MAEHQQASSALVDYVIVVVSFVVVAAVIWNTVRLSSVVESTERNQAHLCWMTETIFGNPEEGTHRACEELQRRLLEAWQAAP
jgi:hypothetical protein